MSERLRTPLSEGRALDSLDRAEIARVLLLLGLPAFGLSLAITMVSTYMPLIIERFTSSSLLIGLIIGGEGIFSILLPMGLGAWSDQVRTRVGRRVPFMLAGTPVAAAALVAMSTVPSLLAISVAIVVFYVGYFTSYTPYRALFPDLVPGEMMGRAQSSQSLWRGLGLGVGLVSGGVLFAAWKPLPFILAATGLIACTAVFLYLMLRRFGYQHPGPKTGSVDLREVMRAGWPLLLSQPSLRAFLIANALWEFALAALKTFIVLFITIGMGYSVGMASVFIGVVAAASVAAALATGYLGDRFGAGRMMKVGIIVYGVGLLAPFFDQSAAVIVPVLPIVAFGGAIVMTLPYALLVEMTPSNEHGSIAGLYSLSRGVGVVTGPIVAGAAIDAMRPVLPSTHGYAALWLVIGVATLLSWPLLRYTRIDGAFASGKGL